VAVPISLESVLKRSARRPVGSACPLPIATGRTFRRNLGESMNNIFYIVGVIVVALAVLGYLGLR
jgi:hypothetical protein